jgi:hypothetical protein
MAQKKGGENLRDNPASRDMKNDELILSQWGGAKLYRVSRIGYRALNTVIIDKIFRLSVFYFQFTDK